MGDNDNTNLPSSNGHAYAHQSRSDLEQPLLLCEPSTDEEVARERQIDTTFCKETRRLISLALPLALQNTLYVMLGIFNTGFVGRLGKLELSAVVLGQAVSSVTASSLFFGLATGLETLAGQAYGAKNYRQVGVVLQRAVFVNLMAAMLAASLWINIGNILLALGQDPDVSALCARYLFRCVPGYLFNAVDICLSRYMMVQGAVRPALISTCSGVFSAPLLMWLFIFKLGWGVDGAGLGFSLSIFTMLAVNCVVVTYRETVGLRGRPEKCFHGWTMEAFSLLPQYLRYAVPSYCMISLEWWTFDVLSVSCGLLPNPTVSMATMGLAMCLSQLTYVPAMGVAEAAITRISNELGAQHPHIAKKAAWCAVCIVLILQCSETAVLLISRHVIGRLWTTSVEVINYLAVVSIPLSISVIGDGIGAVMSGIFRGCGLQHLGMLLNIVTYWGAGVPTGLFLAFKLHMGVPGVWWGLVAGVGVQSVVALCLLVHFKWFSLCDDAAKRVRHLSSLDEQPTEEETT